MTSLHLLIKLLVVEELLSTLSYSVVHVNIVHVKDLYRFAKIRIIKDKWSPDVYCSYFKVNKLLDNMLCVKSFFNYIGADYFKLIT